ncbi:MAG: efflux RND transporter periplasmic adaptor subunit [Saprospiraceae bacterium]
MKNFTRIFSIIALIAILGIFWLYQSDFFSKEKPAPKTENTPTATADKTSTPPGIPVKAYRVEASDLKDFITVNGSTFPTEEAAISSEIAGKVEKILFREGSYVQVGTPLVEIRNTELAAQRQKLSVQKALAEKIAGRLQGLYEKEGVSLQEVDVAKAEVATFEAEIALLDVQLEKTIVKAPFSGRLGLKNVSVGSYVMPGTPIVDLIQMNPLELRFSIPEKYVNEVRNGTKVSFKMAGSDKAHTATVVAREPMIDAETRSLTLQATTSNPNGRILPGTFAAVKVNLANFDEALMIPTQSIVPELDGKKVFKFQSGKAVAVAVETGIRRDASIQVTNGITAGDTILTTGLLQVRPGSEVYISELSD